MFGRNVLLGIVLSLIVVLGVAVAFIFKMVELDALLVGVSIGFIASVMFAVCSYFIQKPRLTIEIDDEDKPSKNLMYFHLIVKNEGVNAAMGCRGHLKFTNLSSKRDFEIAVRWQAYPEPMLSDKFEYSLAPFSEKIDIFSGLEEGICYAVKYGREDEAYGFGNLSYMYCEFPYFSLKKLQWELKSNSNYQLDVMLKHSGGKTKASFIIENNGSEYKDFKIRKMDC